MEEPMETKAVEEPDSSPCKLIIAEEEEVVTTTEESPLSLVKVNSTHLKEETLEEDSSMDLSKCNRLPGLYQLWKQPCQNGSVAVELLGRLQSEGCLEQITMQNNQNLLLKNRLLNTLPCELCGRKFMKQSHLKRHMLAHAMEESKNSVLERGYIQDKLERGYIQDKLDRSFIQDKFLQDKLDRGYIQDKIERGFIQDKLDRGYMVESQLKLQQALSKYFECEMCDKKFAQASTLKNHMFTHTKEKPHACPQCAKRFALGGDLRRHILIHTGEKPYACDQCGKRSARLDNFKKHQQTHRREGVIV